MAAAKDERPALAIGHVSLPVSDVPAATDFFVKQGMRSIHPDEHFAVLELRGGTHLVLRETAEPAAAGTKVPFDLMVDDVKAARATCVTHGMSVSEIETGRIHSWFTLGGPDGYEITVTSSHVSNQPV